MKIAELKLELIQKIIDTNDVETLLKIKDLIDEFDTNFEVNEPTSTYSKAEEVHVFNEWQQARIDIALKQVEDGLVISDEEAEIKIQKWFKEQEKLYGQ